ncbi:hypothetical protein J2S07_001036 [Robertmurraya andreesenii]|uniref:Uncharacterized protein n=1 Tax=Anoxybacillus andreesenii TaxID=1325932 RepID=A0ABT9V1A9_9BACL|nr:hypothetical protein [Robertmurraya andreesenii]
MLKLFINYRDGDWLLDEKGQVKGVIKCLNKTTIRLKI